MHPKKFALSQGIRMARNEWLLFTDADCRPGPQWMATMAAHMSEDTGIVLGQSPYVKKSGFLNLFIQYETFLTALYFLSAAVDHKTYMGLGRNLAYRKSLFYKVNGFDRHGAVMGGDDDLLVQRMAAQSRVAVALEADSRVLSLPKTRWYAYIRQKTRHLGVAKHYTGRAQASEAYRWTVHLAFWLGFGVSCFWSPYALGIFLSAQFVKGIYFNIVQNLIQKRFNPLWLPLVDLCYVVLIPLIRMRAAWVKNNTWN
jgi:hypothetical protein